MIEIYWLLEVMAVMLCLSFVYNKKFKLDINSMVFIILEIVVMFSIKKGAVSESMSFMIYIFYFLYAYHEYRCEVKKQ